MAGEILVGNRLEPCSSLCASRLQPWFESGKSPRCGGYFVGGECGLHLEAASGPNVEVLGVSFQAKASCTASSTPGVTSLGFVNCSFSNLKRERRGDQNRRQADRFEDSFID